MSYRRAWLLVDEINRSLTEPAVLTATGGAKGGGTALKPLGEELVRAYRAIEDIALAAASAELRRLTKLIAP